jgi:uncharacterized protein YggU (UPF0235/DUF167 family)
MRDAKTIRVEVRPSVKRESVSERADGSLEIHVREKAERNMANTRVRELIARHFNVSPKRVRILTGHRSARKTVQVLQ